MLKTLLIILFTAVLSYLAYSQLSGGFLNSREKISLGVAQAKQANNLSVANERVLRLQLSVEDYISLNGMPPDSLYALIPTYFDKVPVNPSTGKEFEYKREGNSYSLGAQVFGADSPQVAQGNELATVLDTSDFVNPNEMEMTAFIYNPEGKRDPFEPFDFSPVQTIDESLPPLERYTLGQLKVTAILSDRTGGRTAFVEDAKGIGYPVREGTKIGSLGGVVVSVESDRVNVVETHTDFTGRIEKNHTVMKLQPKKGVGRQGPLIRR